VSRAKAWFLGGGPGAPDLLTVRAARAIAAADIVIWGARLVMEEAVKENARADAELMPWPPASMDELLDAYSRAKSEDLVVARLVTGDPAVYVDMSQELDRVRELGLEYEIVPGVGALSAAAAALGTEIVTAHTEQSLLITSPKAPLERLADPAEAVAVYMSGEQKELQARLIDAGYPAETPCAVISHATWPAEVVTRTRLDELDTVLKDERHDRQTIVLAGPGLDV
jgi:precorrin-4/cobalt-precorrin-4 C11-methyltransferase